MTLLTTLTDVLRSILMEPQNPLNPWGELCLSDANRLLDETVIKCEKVGGNHRWRVQSENILSEIVEGFSLMFPDRVERQVLPFERTGQRTGCP